MNSLLAGAQLFELSPDDVEVGARIGFFHHDVAVALGRTIAELGQRDPIKVRRNTKAGKPWVLVVGRHRLEGCRAEGINVWAIEVKGKAEDFVDLEASENLHRRDLNPIERAIFVHSLCQAARDRLAREHGDLKPQQLAIKARWARVKAGEITANRALQDEVNDTTVTMTGVYQWNESAADAIGMSKATIERATRIYRLVVAPFPDLAEPLSRHPVVGGNEKQLREIADVQGESDRRKVIEALLADPEISADDARIQIGIDSASKAPEPAVKYKNQIIDGFGRLNFTQQRRFIETELPGMFKTADLLRRAQAAIAKKLAELEANNA